jgi:lactate dehydrogenase-like 2-hydroxyacid dehydrogenase
MNIGKQVKITKKLSYKKVSMKTKILLLSPYKHLPKFSQLIDKYFDVIDGMYINDYQQLLNVFKETKDIKIVFYAPNYKNLLLTNDCIPDTVECILSPSTGLNHIDVQGIQVISVKNDSVLEQIHSTAEHNLYLILSLAKSLSKPPIELSNLSIGILGYGRLGRMLHKYLKPLFKDVYVKDSYFGHSNFYNVDFISINVDLNDSSKDMVNDEYISKFQKNIYIVNTARGEIVNEKDILKNVQNRKVLGYATDVLQEEWSEKESILLQEKNDNILITPHIGGTSIYAQELAYSKTINKYLQINGHNS